MNYLDAKAKCKADGAYLATPRSDTENDYIASLIFGQNIWIGLNDIIEEGRFVSEDGRDISFTKWELGEPHSFLQINGEDNERSDEDGVVLRKNKFWNDRPINALFSFVCIFNIVGEFF